MNFPLAASYFLTASSQTPCDTLITLFACDVFVWKRSFGLIIATVEWARAETHCNWCGGFISSQLTDRRIKSFRQNNLTEVLEALKSSSTLGDSSRSRNDSRPHRQLAVDWNGKTSSANVKWNDSGKGKFRLHLREEDDRAESSWRWENPTKKHVAGLITTARRAKARESQRNRK